MLNFECFPWSLTHLALRAFLIASSRSYFLFVFNTLITNVWLLSASPQILPHPPELTPRPLYSLGLGGEWGVWHNSVEEHILASVWVRNGGWQQLEGVLQLTITQLPLF